jgi:hypothetical protein
MAERLISDNDGPVPGCFGQAGQVAAVGDDAVTWCAQQYDRRGGGVGRGRGSLQDTGTSPVLLGYWAHVVFSGQFFRMICQKSGR